ncbi:MAG: tetratricopeptide repeat protein [Planctomycetia bacterium]|jgi:tetratricopeptide (TPR) repeat protein
MQRTAGMPAATRAAARRTGTWACLIWPAVVAAVPARAAPPVAVAAPDVRIETALEQATKFREAEEYDRALDALRTASGLVKKAKGADHPDLAAIFDIAGQIFFEQGKYPEAEVPLKKAVAIREPLLAAGDDGLEVPQAAALMLLGKIHRAAGRIDTAVDTMKKAVVLYDASLGPEHESTVRARDELVQAVDVFAKQLGPDHEVTIKANEELADVQEALGELPAAAATWRAVYDGEHRRLGAGHARTLRAAGQHARSLALAGRWEEAGSFAAGVAAAVDGDAGRDRAELAGLYRVLADIRLAVEDYSPAEEALRKALAIDTQVDGADGISAAIDGAALGRVAAVRGEFDPQAEGFARTVERLKTAASAGDARAAAGLREAAAALLDDGQTAGAAELYQLALDTDLRLHGPGHADVAADRLGLGKCAVAAGNPEAARPLLVQAVRTCQTALGASHPRTLGAVASLAAAAVEARQVDEAAGLARRLLSHRVPREGEKEDARLARLFDGTAALLRREGRAAEADQLCDSFLQLRIRQFGAGHEYIADAYVNLANARQAANAWAEAIPLYRKGIELQEATLGSQHPDIASTLLPLARAHRAIKQHQEAAVALRRALAIWEATAGADHPVTTETVRTLALAELALGRREEAVGLMERLLRAYEQDEERPVADRVKLLTKLADVRHALGATDAARRYLKQAGELQGRPGESVPSADAIGRLAELARVHRLLGDDIESESYLAQARSLAAKTEKPDEQQRRIDAIMKPVAGRE